MKTDIAAHLALNRTLRRLYVAAQRLANEAADGAPTADVKTKAATLRRQLDAIRKRAVVANSLHRNRTSFVSSFALDDASGAAFMQVSTMTPAALRGFIPHVINAFNSGEPNARSFAAAIVNALDGMDEKARPMEPARFAKILDLPEFDTLSVNAAESVALADAINVVSDQLATSGALSAQGKIAIGLGVRELRPADQLAEEDAAYFTPPETNEDATTTDGSESGGAGDGDGSNSGGEADADNASDGQAEDAGGDDAAGEDGGRAEGSGNESEAVA